MDDVFIADLPGALGEDSIERFRITAVNTPKGVSRPIARLHGVVRTAVASRMHCPANVRLVVHDAQQEFERRQ
jgi:hypothetical protein